MAKLTTRFLDTHPGTGPVLTDDSVPGLRFTPKGSRGAGSWVWRFTSPESGKRRDTGLGIYPTVSLAEARAAAQALATQVRAGIDPLEQRKRDKAATAEAAHAAANVLTFEKAAREVWQTKSAGFRNAKHKAQWIATLEAYVFPSMGGKPLAHITPKDCADALRPIWLEKSETASRTRQRMDVVFQWAWAHGHISANPVRVVEHLLPQQAARVEHQPAMPVSSVPAFVAAHLRNIEPGDSTRAAVLFAMLTAGRSGEVRGARWEEFDLSSGIWTVPADRMKVRILHRVPLSAPALDLVRALKTGNRHPSLVFPSPRGLVLSDMTLTAFLRRVKAPSATQGRCATLHGFRSSFRDWASESGYARDLAERALAHTVANAVERAYARSDLLEQRRPMMEAWAAHVTGTAAPAGNVLPLAKASG